MEVTVCTGITENGTKFSISIYPNPAENYIVLEHVNAEIDNIEITNLAGKVIMQVENDQSYIDISSFYKGVYFVKVQLEDRIEVIKLIKQ